MRDRDVTVEIEPSRGDRGPITFTVGFKSAEPRTAMRVSERLASLFVQENTTQRELSAGSTTQFIEAEIGRLARRVDEFAARIAQNEAAARPSPRSAIVEYEELQNAYRSLLATREQARMNESLERRQIGEQFRMLEAARLPTRPDGPDRLSVSLFGATAGLGLGLVLMLASSKRKPAPPAGSTPA
jgi:uncharacterized protein involved in exopolysaccharide biosynthesis